MKRIVTLGTAVWTLLVLVPAASAGTLKHGYLGAEGVASAVKAAGAKASGVQSSGTLPFTGLNLALLVAGGLFLLALGFGLRRVSRSQA